jgi:glycosyltransferase involved in cell wall biosynthesis
MVFSHEECGKGKGDAESNVNDEMKIEGGMRLRRPTVQDLPTVALGKEGWPWTEGPAWLPGAGPDGKPWPRVSIITPSYNQGRFIEETIRSVLLQGYPDLEYIIIDGGSTDNSVEVIKKYEPWLAYWVSEPDRGQSHAINKGLHRATGQFAAYQNSDDIYWPNALGTVAGLLGSRNVDVLFATADILDEMSRRYRPPCPLCEPELGVLIRFWRGPSNILPSQGFFCRLDILRSIGLFNEKYHYKMDLDVFCRILESIPRDRILWSDEVVAGYRVYEGSKTGLMSSHQAAKEGLDISQRYWSRLPGESLEQLAKEAKHGIGSMAMCRADCAAGKERLRTTLKELVLAWRMYPRLSISRGNINILGRVVHSAFRRSNGLK